MQKTSQVVHLDAFDGHNTLHASFTVGSDIIDYIEPARTFGRDDLIDPNTKGRFQQRMVALPDRRGVAVQPMVITLGNGQRLSLVRRDGESSAGWQSLPLHDKVVAFAAAWAMVDGKELTTLAVALDEGVGASRLLVAYGFDAQTIDWQQLPWRDHGTRDGLAIDALRVQPGDDGVWTVLISAAGSAGQDVYLVRSNTPASLKAHCVRFSVVRDIGEILDFDVGMIEGRPALHTLGVGSGDGQLLLNARKLPQFKDGRPEITSGSAFLCPAGARVMAMGQTRWMGTDVYVAGKGVWRLPAESLAEQDDAEFESVIPASLAHDVLQLSVCEAADGATSVWALQSDGTLLVAQRAGLSAAWGEPVALRRHVVDLAPVVGDDKLTGSVLVVYENGQAAHQWRDAEGHWQETLIRVADPDASASITCFSTNISVLDPAGIPLGDATVQLRTSVLSTLVVNGRSLFVGPQDPVRVQTDLNGNLRIFNRALSFTPASYELALEGLEQVLEINPAASLYQRFTGMSAAELQGAELPGGQGKLLPQALRGKEGTRTVETLLAVLRQAAVLVGGDQATGVRLRDGDQGFHSSLDTRHVADDFCLAVSSRQGQLQAPPVSALAGASTAAAVILPGLGQSLSDLLEGLWRHEDSPVAFLIRKVRGVVEFVCEVAGKVKRFVLDTLEKIGGFFSWLWQQVRTGIDKVWSYAKFLFDWGDISAVRETMADFIGEELKMLATRIHDLREVTTPAFEKAIKAIDKKSVELNLIGDWQKQPVPPGSGSVTQAQREARHKQQNVSHSGPGGGMMDLLGSIVALVVKVEMPQAQTFEGMASAFDKQMSAFANSGPTLQESFQHILGPQGFTLADFDLDKLTRILYALVLNAAKKVTIATQALVEKLIDSVAGFVDLLRRILFARISFPFIEKTFALLTGKSLDTGVRLIDIILFVPSVLGTVTYKLFMGDRPLAPVLASRPALAGALTAQSSANASALDYLKDVVSTYVGMAVLSMGMASAMTGAKAQKATKPLDCLLLSGKAGLLLLKAPWRANDAPSAAANQLRYIVFWLGVSGIAYKGWHLYQGREENLSSFHLDNVDSAETANGVEMMFMTMQSAMKLLALAYEDDPQLLEALQFVARNSALTAYKACTFYPEPLTRGKVVAAATAGAFAFDFMVGMFRHGTGAPKI